MYRYKVSFGPKKNRFEAIFVSYKYAQKFAFECLEAGRPNVVIETVFEDVYRKDGVNE